MPLIESEARLSKLFGVDPKILQLRGEIAKLYDDLGRHDKAAEWREKAKPPGETDKPAAAVPTDAPSPEAPKK
jgi:hypothetical protein